MSSNYVIEIDNLSFSYDNSINILKNINMLVEENQMITIVGPNGGGKTTLLKIIAGLLKTNSGKISFNGNSNKKKSSIAYVPQYSQFDNKFPITVFEVVLTGKIKTFGYYSKEDKSIAIKNLEEVGLLDFKNKSFNALSGGQKQRVLIARALTTEAKILLLDEPTASIDSESEKNLHNLLKKLKETKTIILVTHDTSFVSNITDRVFCINKEMVEHPLDTQFDDMIKASYGGHSVLVRHDIKINPGGGTIHE